MFLRPSQFICKCVAATISPTFFRRFAAAWAIHTGKVFGGILFNRIWQWNPKGTDTQPNQRYEGNELSQAKLQSLCREKGQRSQKWVECCWHGCPECIYHINEDQ